MIKVTFILEELGTFGAALDAGVAFDAGPGNRGHIRRVDGAHRVQISKNAAASLGRKWAMSIPRFGVLKALG